MGVWVRASVRVGGASVKGGRASTEAKRGRGGRGQECAATPRYTPLCLRTLTWPSERLVVVHVCLFRCARGHASSGRRGRASFASPFSPSGGRKNGFLSLSRASTPSWKKELLWCCALRARACCDLCRFRVVSVCCISLRYLREPRHLEPRRRQAAPPRRPCVPRLVDTMKPPRRQPQKKAVEEETNKRRTPIKTSKAL